MKQINNMRQVLYKKWIPRVEKKIQFGTIPEEGTNCWEKDFTHEGLFHQWVNSYEEFESSVGNYTVGLIELQDGTIEEVLPINIKFIDKYATN